MNTTLFLLLTYLMGFTAAIPVGATQIEIAKRSLNDQLRAAYMVITGSVFSDVMYGFIAMFGVAPFLEDKIIVAVFGFAATLLLWLLAFFTFKDHSKTSMNGLNIAALKNKKLSLVIGFSLAVTNPMMIIWWLIGEKFIREIGLISIFTTRITLLYLIVGGAGIFSYLFSFANILHWTKKLISNEMMKKVNYGLGVALVLISIYFLISSIHKLAHL
jgi:threonine/homoserine/homoserine lactone efflux protein